MRNRALQLLAAITAVLLFTNVVSFTTKGSQYSESYPAVVCPPNQSGQSSVISLTSPKMQLRKTGTSTMAFKDARSRRYVGSAQATIIDAQSVTPIMWQVRTGVWAGAVTCLAPITSQWFVGATADLTSKGTLTLVNSGLGKALISVSVFTENGAQADQLFAVKANSFTSISLPTLAPGSQSIAIHVVPQTGRVNAFLTDERGRGLKALGGDNVNSQESAAKEVVIPAIPQQTGKKSSLPHTLRILIPGEVGATISVGITSTDGTFSPAGIDGKMIPAGKVVDLPLDVIMPSGKFALHISAERPFVASVFTKTNSLGKSDFLWSTPAPQLEEGTFAVSGLAPLLVFTGDQIQVDLELTSVQGKKRNISLRGSDIATYQVSEKIRSFTITHRSAKTYGAALVTSKSGFGYTPLVIGSTLTRTSIPRSNIRVLIP
jgi:hypothetical protein